MSWLDWFNPRVRVGMRFSHWLHVLFEVLLILALFAATFGAGFHEGQRHPLGAAYFERRYQASIKVPTAHKPLSDHPQAPSSTAPISVDSRYLPHVFDQGPLGSCAGNAAAAALSYEYRRWPGHKHWSTFSPLYLYSHYSCTYNNGQDGGSYAAGDLEAVPTEGVATYAADPEPPYVINCAPSQTVQNVAAAFRLPIQTQELSNNMQGEGQGIIDAIAAALAQGHVVPIAIPVWSQFYGATQQPVIVSPTDQQVQQQPSGFGGHEITVTGINFTHVDPDGTVGYVRIRNSWGTSWGQNGNAKLTLDYLRRYLFGATIILFTANS